MKTLVVVAGLIIEKGKILVTQRKENTSYGFFWEFPGGKVMDGEEPRQALQRELREELGIETEAGRLFEAVSYAYPTDTILLLVYLCRIEKGTPEPVGCRDLRWATLREITKLSMLPADQSILERLSKEPELA